MLLKASNAVTVRLNAVPAVALPGALTMNDTAGPPDTAIGPLVPVMLLETESLAVMVLFPEVSSVTLNVPLPLDNVELAGNIACASLLLNCTVPEYPVARLLNASSAVTVILKALPAIAAAGPLTTNRDAAAAPTVIALLLPVIELLTVSVPLMFRLPAVFRVALNVPTPPLKVESAGRTACPSVDMKCTMPA